MGTGTVGLRPYPAALWFRIDLSAIPDTWSEQLESDYPHTYIKVNKESMDIIVDTD